MRHRLAIGWVTFVVLAIGVSPAHFWLDAGEITAAGASLGVMHPTGVPGYTHLLRLFAALPIGALGWRLGLVSAVFGTAAVSTLVAILARRDAHPLTWWGAAMWALCGLTFLRHGRTVEIYTFATWLTLVAVWGLDPLVEAKERTGTRLLGVGAAVWASWCFGDLRLALAPPVIVMWFVALRRAEPWARWAPTFVVLTSLVVATIPLSSAREPLADWGDPDSLGRLWDHLQARSIRVAFGDQILPNSAATWRVHAGSTLVRLGEDIGPLGIPLVVLGAARWVSDPRERGAAWLVVWIMAVELFYAVGINPMGGIDRQTGLVLAFCGVLTVGTQVAVLARGEGDEASASSSGPRHMLARWVVGPLVWTMGILPALWISAADIHVTRSWMPHRWTREALAQLPPRSLLLTQSDDLSAGVLAARVLEGARPDVVSLPAQHLHKPAPERADAREAAAWRAAATGVDERTRIEAVLRSWSDPVAVEMPLVDVFGGVPWYAPHGDPPLAIDRSGPTSEDVSTWTETWLARCEGPLDRLRVARAVAARARATLIVGQGSIASLVEAETAYRIILDRVEPDHASSMVALGTVLDRLGRTQSAISLTRRALELEPDRITALRNLALYLARSPAGLDEAKRLAERAVALDPDDAKSQARLAEICAALGDVDCG